MAADNGPVGVSNPMYFTVGVDCLIGNAVMASRSRHRGRLSTRKPSDSRNGKSVVEEPHFSLGGRSPEEVYRLTLLDSANVKRTITRRLSQLNHLVRFRRTAGSLENYGIPFAVFLRFGGLSLCDACKEIRAAAFRAIRHHTSSREHCHQLHEAHVDFYLARAFDMAIDNEVERLQAMCLARRMIQLGSVPGSVVNALVAIAAEGGEERERMSRICVETLCEILVYCPDHPGIVTVLRVLMGFLMTSNSVALTTAVVAAIGRFSARSDHCIPSHFCDITQVLHPVTSFEGIEETGKQEVRMAKAVMIQAAKNAIVAAFRTWEGLHLLTASSSGIRSLVGILFLSNKLAQEAVLDIVVLLLYLPAEWEPSSRNVCDSWSLQENFVADEAQALLPHISRTRVNLCANYLAVLLFIFHQSGLIDGLVHAITAEGKFQQRAFHILNNYLALANIYLPAEFTGQMQTLPSLVSLATNLEKLSSRVQGAETLANLLRCNSRRETTASCECVKNASIHLEHVMTIAGIPASEAAMAPMNVLKDSEGTSLIREAVSEMTNHEFHGWKWQTHISTLLKAKAVHRDDPLGYKYDQEY